MHLNKIILHPDKYPTRSHYPFNLQVFQETHEIPLTTPVTFFVGENGSGKSTLLKAISYRCGIYIWEDKEHTQLVHNRYEEDLFRYIVTEWVSGSVPGSFFSSQIFQDFARFLDAMAQIRPQFLDYFGGKSLMTCSHGEAILAYFSYRYRIKGLYLLDEPETALSPVNQIKLLKILQEASRDGHAQFIIASHSPILLACPGATIYSFDETPVQEINYESTEYFRLYRDFLNNREKYLLQE